MSAKDKRETEDGKDFVQQGIWSGLLEQLAKGITFLKSHVTFDDEDDEETLALERLEATVKDISISITKLLNERHNQELALIAEEEAREKAMAKADEAQRIANELGSLLRSMW